MPRRFLIHYPVLNLGGAEMSTLRLARALADRGWQVELVVTTGGGDLEARLDPRVKLTALRSRSTGERFAAARTFGARLRALPDLAAYLYQRVREVAVSVRYLFRRYDAAAIGLQGLSPAFCCDWVRAGRRFHWIRNDVVKVDDRGRVARRINRYHHRIDHYVCVAETARETFVAAFPQLRSKAVTIHNVIDAGAMRRQAQGHADPFAGHGQSLKVLTVCRLQEDSKGLVRMARVHRRLRERGLDFHWFVVGDGPDRAVLEAAVAELGIGDRFILAGPTDDPFGYYVYADLVAVLSYYEGLCGTVNEAKAIGRPVLVTRFPGVTEQIEDGVNGLIVDNDEDAIVEGMARMLTDPALRERLAAQPLPPAIADDDAKLDRLEALVLGAEPREP